MIKKNIVKNEVNVNDNYERLDVVEECNDEIKRIEDDLNHDNVEEQNLEDVATNEKMNILPVDTTQDVLESQYQKVPKE